MLAGTEREERRTWSTKENRSSEGKVFVEKNTSTPKSIDFCQTVNSLKLLIFTYSFPFDPCLRVSASFPSYPNPGKLRPEVSFPISASEMAFAWERAWFAAVKTMSSRSWASAGLSACGSILIEAIEPSHLATTLTAPPPLVASTVRLARPACTCSICCCMRAACFMSFPMLDINVRSTGFGSGADFDDLPFEDFERLQNEGIVFKILGFNLAGGRFGWLGGRGHGRGANLLHCRRRRRWRCYNLRGGGGIRGRSNNA